MGADMRFSARLARHAQLAAIPRRRGRLTPEETLAEQHRKFAERPARKPSRTAAQILFDQRTAHATRAARTPTHPTERLLAQRQDFADRRATEADRDVRKALKAAKGPKGLAWRRMVETRALERELLEGARAAEDGDGRDIIE